MWCASEGRATEPYKKNAQACADYPRVLKEELATIQATLCASSAGHQKKTKKIKLWFFDESRFGLHVFFRRRITLCGIKPIAPFNDVYESVYLFGSFAPEDGSQIHWEFPCLDTETFQAYLNAFSCDEQAVDTYNVIIMDNAPVHHAKKLTIPENIALCFLPAYCPELNPAERVWQYLKDRCANIVFDNLEELSSYLQQIVMELTKERIMSITSYSWIMEIINAQLIT